jgi:hypothetical protein
MPVDMADMDGLDWSEMAVSIPRRPERAGRARGRKASKATDYGTTPTRLWRTTLDGRVFSAKRHARQGTVLIDQSGSMSLGASDVRELIDGVAAAIVAVYSGDGEVSGELRIVAANGHTVRDRDLESFGYGNQVDGPAVYWLAHQRGPRIWVCDYDLTGNYDHGASEEMYAQVERLMRAYRIRRLDPLVYDDDETGDAAGWINQVRRYFR